MMKTSILLHRARKCGLDLFTGGDRFILVFGMDSLG